MMLRSPSRVSLALRIALASALFGLIVAGGAIAVGFWTLSQQLDERAATEMHGRRELLVHILSTVPSVNAVGDAKERFADLFFGHDDLHLALVEPATGRVLAAFSDLALGSVAAIAHATAAPDTVHAWVTATGARFSGMHGVAEVADGGDVRFYLSVERHRDAGLLAGFIKATLVALPLLLLIVAAGSGLIARTGLAPLHRFNRLAASIGAQSLSKRISVSGLPGELEDMAREFNNMLERIDEGYRQLKDFSGDLAHEMRTPVATLLGRTQVALSQTRTAAELRQVLEGNVEQFERLSALISDMLFLARADHNVTAVQTEPVDLSVEAQKVADYLSLVAEEKQLRLHVAGAAPPILADRLLVQRAITNLVSNAIRHAFERSTIIIGIASTAQDASLSVTNEGEGIAPENRDRIFERFYRLDQGRSRDQGGSGLGLAIVRSIASLHQGRVEVACEAGRTSFTLWLPRLPQASEAGTA
jgi:two-component system, OmpR family, heavy metal sensor histidine kinase CusS